MADRPTVIVTRKLPDVVETRLRELFDAKLNLDDKPFTREQLIDVAKSANVLVPTVTDRIDRAVLSQAGPNLKLIAQFGTGVDNIDLETARNRSILVTNTPGVLTEDTADLAMGLILAVSRRIVEGAGVVAAGGFEGWTPTWMCGRKLWGKRLGIVGMGRIGQALARRARAFGMQVHYHNRKPVPDMIAEELGATYWDDLDQMLARMDIISLNTPATRETRHLLSAERLARLQPHALLINTARGELIDEAALAEAVARRAIAGVGLDVYEHEPAVHPGLLGHANVVLLPHLGSATRETRDAMGMAVLDGIDAVLAGRADRFPRHDEGVDDARPDGEPDQRGVGGRVAGGAEQEHAERGVNADDHHVIIARRGRAFMPRPARRPDQRQRVDEAEDPPEHAQREREEFRGIRHGASPCISDTDRNASGWEDSIARSLAQAIFL